jgi:hypothetical protein
LTLLGATTTVKKPGVATPSAQRRGTPVLWQATEMQEKFALKQLARNHVLLASCVGLMPMAAQAAPRSTAWIEWR